MKHLIKNLMVVLLLSLPAMAADTDDLTKLIKEKVAYITGVLRDGALTKADKNVKMEGATDYLFDYALMGRLSLGKEEWSSLNDNEKEEYGKLFERRIKDSYMDKLHLYSDEEVAVENAVVEKKGRIRVPCFIIAKDGKTEMVYKFYQAKSGSWLIYDVEIAGVSIVQTYRAQFAEILKNTDVHGLIGKMRSSGQL